MIKLDEKIFDNETKEYYLKENMDSDNSVAIYCNFLNKIGKNEEEQKKKIYNMDMNELEELFHSLQIRGTHSMLNAMYFCKRYIAWAKENGFADHREDLLPSKFDTAYVKRFVNSIINKRYLRNEVLENIEMIDDPRYGAAILCLFEGIRGQGLEELANLKMDDLSCDDENICRAQLTSTGREITISNELYNMLEKLNEVKNVGTLELAARFALAPSPYIFKKVERKNASNDLQITATFLTRTIKAARAAFNNNKLVANDITRSGIAHYASELMTQAGERILTNNMLKLIALKYDVGLINKEAEVDNSKEEFYYSYGAIKKMIDVDFISQTYGDFQYE